MSIEVLDPVAQVETEPVRRRRPQLGLLGWVSLAIVILAAPCWRSSGRCCGRSTRT